MGWDNLRKERYARQIETGLINKKSGFSDRDTAVRAWNKLSQNEKEKVAYRMAVYAAQVKCIDDNVGKLIATLKQRGEFENTMIIFLSDNGACAEMYDELGTKEGKFINDPDFSDAVSYGVGWANASNTPFRKWKTVAEEGGISAPFIVQWPIGVNQKNTIVQTPAYLIDVMPTILSVSGAAYPAMRNNENIYALTGYSLQPAFTGKKLTQHEYMYWEHQSHAAVRKGDWKAISIVDDFKWSLYNLSTDRSEMHDVAAVHPDIVKDLSEHWHTWATENFVLPKRLKK